MTRRMTVRQPIDLALSLEMGQSFRWRRVECEEVPPRDWGDPTAPLAEGRRGVMSLQVV